ASHLAVGPRRAAQRARRSTNWRRQAEKWRHLMAAAQGGESRAYETLLRELDAWLRRYYARRLPAAAAEDARQDALLAIHAKREAYSPSKPFGPWVVAIARYSGSTTFEMPLASQACRSTTKYQPGIRARLR